MKNHLFIGLGGFGGRTLAEIRKCEYLNKEFVASRPEDAPRVDYLYVDSSMDVANTNKHWKVLGESVKLKPVDIIELKKGGVADTFDAIDGLPHVKSWIGSQEDIEKYLKGSGTGEGANQRRRFGRYLFASNADQFISKLHQKVSGGGKTECTFHIFATMAGGTGSGSLIDAITLIRSEYPDDESYPIYVYCYATDRSQDSGADVGFFYPNQYAVLRDLNGLMTGTYTPQNVGVQKIQHVDPTRKYIDLACIITPENKDKVIFEPSDQVKLVGQWAYQRVLADVFGNIDEDVAKALTGQDILTGYLGEKDKNETPIRSCRFGSIGLKRWSIPEEPMKEALMLNYLEQAFRQMIYNNWDNQNGYMASPKGQVTHAGLLEKVNLSKREQWILSDQEGELPYDDEWKIHAEEFNFTVDLETSVKNLISGLKDYGLQRFRKSGIDGYFNARTVGLNQHADEVERQLISYIDEQWKSGKVGFEDVCTKLQSLTKHLTENLLLEYKEKVEVLNGARTMTLQSIKDKWLLHANKAGWLAKNFGAEKKMYKRCREQAIQACIDETSVKGYQFAINLIELLDKKISNLVGSVTMSQEEINTQLKDIKKDKKGLLPEVKAENSLGKDIIEFNKQDFDDIWLAMRRDQSLIEQVASMCRDEILHDHLTLPTLHSVTKSTIRQQTETIAANRIQEGHDKACRENNHLAGKHVLGRNIWDLINQKDKTNKEDTIRKFLESSVTIAKRSSDLPPKHYDKTLQATMPREHMLLLNPGKEGDNDEQEQQFKEQLQSGTIHFEEHDNPSEILCLSIDSAAPARMFNVVHKLYEHYKEKAEGTECRYFCHLDPESEKQDSHPHLLRENS